MIIIPQQYFGIGDCIYIQSLLRQLCEPGDKILYPVMQQFAEGLNRAYPDATFIDYKMLNIDYEKRTQVETLTHRILPIRFADQILGLPYTDCMRAKYILYGLDYNSWRNTMFKRDMEREKELGIRLKFPFSDCVNGYNLISPYYGSSSQFKANIELDNGLPNVYMSSIPGYSLMDYSLLIENATTIHAVSSAIVYLLELLNLQATEVHLYSRHIEPDTWYKNIEYILTRNYIIHESSTPRISQAR